MKLPNFRLHETQARLAGIFGILAILCLAALAVVVFKNFSREMMAINFNPQSGLGRYRKMIVFGVSAMTIGIGLAAGFLGFSSLGEKRNTKQGMSWLGLLLGALAVSIAPVFLFAWTELSQSIITGG